MACKIPIMPPFFPMRPRETPISQRENLMLAFEHKKPMFMPLLAGASQFVGCRSSRDMAPSKGAAGVDWFGTNYIYSDTVGINMPAGGVFESITEWREKLKFPDLKAIDWSHDADGFVRDEEKALCARFSNGIFERLHAFEGFEQCLVDLLIEPDECRDFFNRMADYKIELFNIHADLFPLDYLVAADDYGTARAPFFSTAVFEDLLLEPTRRFVQAVHERGCKFLAHCCGKVDVFIPYLVEDIGVDAVEIQPINDLKGIMQKYGDRLMLEIMPDNEIVFDDETTDEQLIAHIHDLVDTYGAHTNPGSGGVMVLKGNSMEHCYLMEDELYDYSLRQYASVYQGR